MIRSVKGFGYCSDPTLTARIDGVIVESYQKWVSMLDRVYSEKYHAKFPTYKGVSVAKEWHDYAVFKDWFDSYQYKSSGWELDKDLIFPDMKLYSPETCSIIPKEINYLLAKGCGKSKHSELPVGVTFHKRVGKYYMQCCIGKGLHFKEYHENSDTARQRYIEVKMKAVRDMAELYAGLIHPDIYQALKNWEIK